MSHWNGLVRGSFGLPLPSSDWPARCWLAGKTWCQHLATGSLAACWQARLGVAVSFISIFFESARLILAIEIYCSLPTDFRSIEVFELL